MGDKQVKPDGTSTNPLPLGGDKESEAEAPETAGADHGLTGSVEPEDLVVPEGAGIPAEPMAIPPAESAGGMPEFFDDDFFEPTPTLGSSAPLLKETLPSDPEMLAKFITDKRLDVLWGRADSAKNDIDLKVHTLDIARGLLDQIKYARSYLLAGRQYFEEAERHVNEVEFRAYQNFTSRKWSTSYGVPILIFEIVCAVALALPTGEVISAEGVYEGLICEEPAGDMGFGYETNTTTYPYGGRNMQGWGMANVEQSIVPRAPRSFFYDDFTNISNTAHQSTIGMDGTGDYVEYTVVVADSSEPLKVTLTWTDFADSSTSTYATNNLDLLVTPPAGLAYYGNNFSGGWSNTTATYDTINNTEAVYVKDPVVGTWTVRVTLANAPSGTYQPFALFVSGGLGVTPSTTRTCSGLTSCSGRMGSSAQPYFPSVKPLTGIPIALKDIFLKDINRHIEFRQHFLVHRHDQVLDLDGQDRAFRQDDIRTGVVDVQAAGENRDQRAVDPDILAQGHIRGTADIQGELNGDFLTYRDGRFDVRLVHFDEVVVQPAQQMVREFGQGHADSAEVLQ